MRQVLIEGIIILAIVIAFGIPVMAEGLNHSEVFESEEVEFQKMHTTAYCLHGTTATGGTTRPNIAACNTHVGEIAVIYTLDGEYLGQFEITDTGKTNGLKAGKVIDVWFDTYDECKQWMRITEGKVRVQWIKGIG